MTELLNTKGIKNFELVIKARNYAIECHRKANHFYGDLPYEYHLQMAYDQALRYIHLIPEEWQAEVLAGIWVHDVIEDARQTYNNVLEATSYLTAEFSYALSNDKGKTRKERAGEKYYSGIRALPFADYLKICDRLANVTHGVLTGGSMAKGYKKENPDFRSNIDRAEETGRDYTEMWNALDLLFTQIKSNERK